MNNANAATKNGTFATKFRTYTIAYRVRGKSSRCECSMRVLGASAHLYHEETCTQCRLDHESCTL
jgi:hypothetical protein